MSDRKVDVRLALDLLARATLLVRAASQFSVRDRLGISDVQADAQARQTLEIVASLLIRGAAAETVCARWNHTAELGMLEEQMRAEAEAWAKEQKPLEAARKELPLALNREESRREQRRRKARHEHTQSPKEAPHETT